jgi:hypothetical protein
MIPRNYHGSIKDYHENRAAQFTRGANYPLPLPDYAVDLLLAAKAILAHEQLSSTGDERLGEAVEVFEDNMPLTPEGEIVMVRANGGRA